ncbi:MAG: hypothetical protein Q8S00_08340 [Deltaproteobacteria bacterium]|nr:hypothetical protein [Deltaproteobacteria bacterium]
MTAHLGDLSSASHYRVHLEFTAPREPDFSVRSMPFVSVITEIEANSSSARGEALRKQYNRIPYGSPLYWWEIHSSSGRVTCAYIGQTVRLQIRQRFKKHRTVLSLLAQYANSPDECVMFRLCSRFDICYGNQRIAIEHLPPDQAAKVINDVEALLIFEKQPILNVQHKRKRKTPWKPFVLERVHLGQRCDWARNEDGMSRN